MLSIIKPVKGSGDGTTEYAYQLHKKLKGKKEISVSIDYFLDRSKRNNATGLLYVYSLMNLKANSLSKGNYDVIHIMSHEIGSMAKLLKKRGVKAKIITTIHDTTRLEKGMHTGIMQKSYNMLVKRNLKDALENSDHIIYVSERTKREIENRFKKIVPSSVIMHGLRDELFATPFPKRQKSALLTIGYLGSFAHHKNVILLLKAAKMMKDASQKARFVIYGTGFEEKNLQKFKRQNMLDNVVFKGFAPEEEIVKIYDSFDIFVFPSMYEGFGFHILEAQARGVPVMVMKNSVLPDEVKKYAIEIKDEKEFIEKIEDIKKKEYKKWTIAAMEYAKRFMWEKAANSILAVYKRTMKGR